MNDWFNYITIRIIKNNAVPFFSFLMALKATISSGFQINRTQFGETRRL